MNNLDFIKVKRFALMQLQGRWILPLVVQLITFLVGSLFYVPIMAQLMPDGALEMSQVARDAVVAAEKPLPFVSMMLFLLTMRIFFVAELSVYVAMTRGPEKVGFGTFIDGFADWWRAAAVTFLKGLFLYLWALLFFFPAVIKFYSYYFAEYVVAEFPQVKAQRAIGISRRVMHGAKWQMFMLDLTLFPWVLLGTIIGAVGLMWAMPYVRMTHINAFHALLKGAIEDGRVTLEELGARSSSNSQETGGDGHYGDNNRGGNSGCDKSGQAAYGGETGGCRPQGKEKEEHIADALMPTSLTESSSADSAQRDADGLGASDDGENSGA